MSYESFSDLLREAIEGNHDAVEDILEMYRPLIESGSFIGGVLDEDCRQYIMIRIALSISKFSI